MIIDDVIIKEQQSQINLILSQQQILFNGYKCQEKDIDVLNKRLEDYKESNEKTIEEIKAKLVTYEA